MLQRCVLDWIAEQPWAPSNEAMVLGLLADTQVPAPRVIAADPDGALTGAPMVLMTALPGRVIWEPPDLDAWLYAMVDHDVTIHRSTAVDTLRPWEPYGLDAVPPVWTQHRWDWGARSPHTKASVRPATVSS